ncbi:MAG: hypothetical protein IB616_00025 [Methanosarcinales archaeon]|nr:MAG: hypothetical protein IB616_00025 [Methanosarcinales archaeon]
MMKQENQIVIIAAIVAILMTVAVIYYPIQHSIPKNQIDRLPDAQVMARAELVNFVLVLLAKLIDLGGILAMTALIALGMACRKRVQGARG